jgi:DNA-binding LytR/AlgR family response regulator
MEGSMIQIAIVEDEKEIAECLSEYAKRYSQERMTEIDITFFSNGLDFLSEYKPIYDIVLMDIKMPYLDGMETAKKLRKVDPDVCLIFVTNLANYAIKGYEVSASDFIIKPVNYFDFSTRLKRAIDKVNTNRDYSVILESKDVVRRVSVREIYYIEVFEHFLVYHLKRDDVTVRGQMKTVEEELSPFNFARCHNCYLVNMKYVTELTPAYVVVGDKQIPISRRRHKDFSQALTNYLGGGVL